MPPKTNPLINRYMADDLVIPLPPICTTLILYGGILSISAITHCYGFTIGCFTAMTCAISDVLFVMFIKNRYGLKTIIIQSSF